MRGKKLSRQEKRRLVQETHRGRKDSVDETRREELLRPNPNLGYDRDRLALHLIEREAYSLAEGELRRAIWLNPFEPAFRLHLAFCLYRQKRYGEAREALLEAGGEGVAAERAELMKLIEEKLRR